MGGVGSYSPLMGVSMSPLYDYHCQECGIDFDKVQSYKGRDMVSCPDCGIKAERKVSFFNFKLHNPFTKDGEGFTRVKYHPQEYKERVRANASKYN